MVHLRDRIITFFYGHASTQGKHKILLTFLGGCFFCCILSLVIFLALLSDKWLGLQAWLPSPINLILSIPLLAAGIWLWLWSVLTFFTSKGTPVPVSPPPKLVDSGPYAYSRNPMLSGVFLMLFGVGFLLQSPSLVVIFTPLFMAIAALEFKMIEEPELEKRLGAPYVAYRKKVGMFFPKKKNGGSEEHFPY
jgi:protein-S-isoprenylcysteine O-methyltransferase Ste14